MKKIVLAYSGGLDTSYCLKYFKTHGHEVHSVLVNTGGFEPQELQMIEEKAYQMGSDKHVTLDCTLEYYNKCIKYLIFGNILKNNTYPLSVSSERIFQALSIAKYASENQADYIAHGSTGAGNDQVRFDLAFSILAPEAEILTPIRDNSLSREEEINFLIKNGIKENWEKKAYSVNKGLWGTSIGGKETLESRAFLPENVFTKSDSSVVPKEIALHFKQGELIGMDDKPLSPVEAIKTLNKIAESYGIGRDIHVGDTIVGIKGRVGFEAGGPMMVIKAHQALEKHVLSKWQLQLKTQQADWYGMFLHEGQYLEPVMRDIEAYLESSQSKVSGKAYIHLEKGSFRINGIASDHDLMKAQFGVYGETNNAWTAADAKGFINILGTSLKNYYSVNSEKVSV